MKLNLDKVTKNLEDNLSAKHLIVIAGVLSLLLGVALFFLLDDGDSKKKEEAPVVKNVTVVAASKDIAARTIIKDDMLKVVEMPSDKIPAGAVLANDKASILNMPATVQIQKGDVVTDRKVMKDLKMAGFTGMIPPDCRAMAVGINDVTGVAGFAKGGDYVDVMIVSGNKDSEKITSNIVLQNVLLLAINKTGSSTGDRTTTTKKEDKKDKADGDKDKKEGEEKAQDNSIKADKDSMATATLALTPQQVTKLAAYIKRGELYLVLRPYQPRDKFVFDTDFSISGIKKSSASTASKPQSAPIVNTQVPIPSRQSAPAASAPYTSTGSVEVIRGNSITHEGR